MERVYNFAAGPACLPEEVLRRAASELVCYGNSGMSVMEMSHRSHDFEEIIDKAESDLRELMNIPDNYKVLFLQGGASLQFAMVPINLMAKFSRVHFINTGMWSKRAISEANKIGEANVVASSEDKTFSYIPKLKKEMFTKDADYVHMVSNNTIYGTRYTKIPDVNGLPLVSDMSSCILSEAVNVSDYALIFAGAQKNMGPSGVTTVIIREDMIGKEPDNTPTLLSYKTHAQHGSMYNTPPTYAIYILGLVLEWLKGKGGISAINKINQEKAKMLYDFLDESKLFKGTVRKEDRSLMNIPFITGNADIDKQFIEEAKKNGFVNIKGHRSVGGMRASIYNAFPPEGVKALVDFMKKFEANA
ncbi:MAG: 3-phosphoserine/phosphohydroxythreonine transaminase [Eubacteriales bacterium]